MEAIIIDLEIVDPILLEIGVESEMMVNPTPAPAFIKGEKGDTGERGLQGEQGIQGEKGDAGVILLDSHIGGSLSNNNQFARLRDVLIPANTLSDGDVIQINVLVFQSLTSVAKNARLHLTQNLSTALDNSNQIAISVQGTTSNIQFAIIREFIYWQGSLQLLQSSVTQAVTDPIANGGVSTDELFPFDASVDNYISISAGSAANNTYLKTLKRSLFKLIKA